MSKIQTSDLFGRFFIKKSHSNKRIQYYQTLDILRPMIMSKEFNNLTTGWYIHNTNGVRLSFFIKKDSNPEDVIDYCESWFLTKDLDMYKEIEYPHEEKIVLPYADEDMEEKFRNYLLVETLIALDLLEEPIRKDTRVLFAVLRKNFVSAIYLQQILKAYFKHYSTAYSFLGILRRDEFIEQLTYQYIGKTSWFHLMINTILSCDKYDGKIWNETLKELGL